MLQHVHGGERFSLPLTWLAWDSVCCYSSCLYTHTHTHTHTNKHTHTHNVHITLIKTHFSPGPESWGLNLACVCDGYVAQVCVCVCVCVSGRMLFWMTSRVHKLGPTCVVQANGPCEGKWALWSKCRPLGQVPNKWKSLAFGVCS